jgi:hypothetical protein
MQPLQPCIPLCRGQYAACAQIDKDRVLGMLSIRDVVKVVVGEHREQLSQMRDYITGSY